MKSFNEIYFNIIKEVYEDGMETSPRGMKIKEKLAYSFVSDPNDNIITLPGFKTNLDYAKLELEWYLSGSNRIDFHPTIQKVWKNYSDDGVHVNSAYGHRIFGKHPEFINQWEWCKNKLKQDPDSRQCVININTAKDKEKPTKDFCCTMFVQVFISNGKLHWITNLRSQDIFFGMRNDVWCFSEMQKLMAKELGIEVGLYHHFCGSLHLYSKHFEKAKELIKGGLRL